MSVMVSQGRVEVISSGNYRRNFYWLRRIAMVWSLNSGSLFAISSWLKRLHDGLSCCWQKWRVDLCGVTEEEQSSKINGKSLPFLLWISAVDCVCSPVCQDFRFRSKHAPALYTSWKSYQHGGHWNHSCIGYIVKLILKSLSNWLTNYSLSHHIPSWTFQE